MIFEPGYYWAREDDGTHFIVLLEDGEWYCCGVENPATHRDPLERTRWPA